MQLLYIIVLLAALYEVHAAANGRACGHKLVQALESICLNGYNSKPIKKSAPPVHSVLDTSIMNMYNDIEEQAPSLTKTSFLDDMLLGEQINTFAQTRRRRNLFGIYDECCLKACSITELKSYCI